MTERNRHVGYALLGLGFALILVGVIFATFRYIAFIASGSTLSTDVSPPSLVGVLSQILFLAAVYGAGSILVNRGAKFIRKD